MSFATTQMARYRWYHAEQKQRPLRPRRSYFAPAETQNRKSFSGLRWRRRVPPPGPNGLLRRPFIAISGLRRQDQYRRIKVTNKGRFGWPLFRLAALVRSLRGHRAVSARGQATLFQCRSMRNNCGMQGRLRAVFIAANSGTARCPQCSDFPSMKVAQQHPSGVRHCGASHIYEASPITNHYRQ